MARRLLSLRSMMRVALLVVFGACGFSPSLEGAQPDAQLGSAAVPDATGSAAPNPVPCHIIDPTLRLCLDFEDASLDPTVLDSLELHDGRSQDVTAMTRAGQQAAAFTQDASVHVDETPDLDIDDNLSWEAWIDLTEDHQTTWPIDNDKQYALRIADNRLVCYGGGTYAYTAFDLGTHEWHHVACVYGGGTLQAYVDGQLQGCTFTSGSIANVNTMGMDFGADFEGGLDDIHIYASALSAADVAAHAGTSPSSSLPQQCSASYGGDLPLLLPH